jgi:hypothetical protein
MHMFSIYTSIGLSKKKASNGVKKAYTRDANEMNDTQLMSTLFSRVKCYSDIESIAEGVKSRKDRSPTKK